MEATDNYSSLLLSMGDINATISQINIDKKTCSQTEIELLTAFRSGLSIDQHNIVDTIDDSNSSLKSVKGVIDKLNIQWLDLLYWNGENKPSFFSMFSRNQELKNNREIVGDFFDYAYRKIKKKIDLLDLLFDEHSVSKDNHQKNGLELSFEEELSSSNNRDNKCEKKSLSLLNNKIQPIVNKFFSEKTFLLTSSNFEKYFNIIEYDINNINNINNITTDTYSHEFIFSLVINRLMFDTTNWNYMYFFSVSTKKEKQIGYFSVACDKKLIPEECAIIRILGNILLFPFTQELQAVKDWEQIRQESIKSAIAAIMSRNMSHNLGSHVISGTKNYLVNRAFKTTKGDNKGVYRLLQYFQERMDFVAVICNSVHNHYTFNAPLNLKADILDEFAADGRDERHNGNMKEEEHTKSFLLDYIVRSEQVYRSAKEEGTDRGIEIVLFRKKNDKYLAFTSQKNGDNNSRDFNDINFSVPLGINSRHAFLTILENFMRNSAKHNHVYPDKVDKLLISVLIEENGDKYTVKIFDNKQDISGYECDGNETLKLQDELNKTRILDENGTMETSHKGMKEMLICSAWLQDAVKDKGWDVIEENKGKLLNYYPQKLSEIKENLVVGQDKNNNGKTDEIKKLLDSEITSLGIEFTLPKHCYIYCENIDLDKGGNLDKCIENLKSADFYVVKIKSNANQKESVKKLNYALPKVIFVLDEMQQECVKEIKRELPEVKFVLNKKQQIHGKDIDITDNNQNNNEEVLLWCYQQLGLNEQKMLISYKDHPTPENDSKSPDKVSGNVITRTKGNEKKDTCIPLTDKIRLFINHNDGPDIFVGNYKTCLKHYQNNMLFLEGISGASFNYNLLINAGIGDVDYYKIIHACDSKIAIIDERLFDKYKHRKFNDNKLDMRLFTKEQVAQVESDINEYKTTQENGCFKNESIEIIQAFRDGLKGKQDIKNWIDNNPTDVEKFIKELKEELSNNWSQIWLKMKNIFIYNVKKEFTVNEKAGIIDFDGQNYTFDHDEIGYLSVHYSIIDKYAKTNNLVFKQAYEQFLRDIGIDSPNTNIRITIHSGRGGVAEIQKLPFIPVSMIDSQLEDCKYKLAQLFLNMKYKR